MAERKAGSIRARVRSEMTDEIKAVARKHLAATGLDLSLRAVARDMGMVSSAVYRYFASRDDLLTALIVDAYNSLGEAAEHADAGVADRADLLGRWLAVTHGLRDWALARPHEYALTYGSPLPGYHAPQDTVGPSTRPVLVLGAILAEVDAQDAHDPDLTPALRAELDAVADLAAPGVPAEVISRGMIAWTEVFGAISFELFGRINNVINERRDWFDHQMRAMARYLGLH